MRSYRCRVCTHPLHVENPPCVSCRTRLGAFRLLVVRTWVPLSSPER